MIQVAAQKGIYYGTAHDKSEFQEYSDSYRELVGPRFFYSSRRPYRRPQPKTFRGIIYTTKLEKKAIKRGLVQ